jgi:sulfotransferase family protein
MFVVGCSRSGTTLLQSFLAAHPAVLSFPETAVFGRLLWTDGEAQGTLNTVHRRTRLARRRVATLLERLGRRELEELLPLRSKSREEFAHAFIRVLDRLTLDRGKLWWVEKTPENIRYVPEIGRLVPGARFINILRDGRDTVASLYSLALEYPDKFWARFLDLDLAIEHWNVSLRHARALLRVPNVLLVRYERLLAEAEAVLGEICAFAGLAFSREMIDRRSEVASELILDFETWKARVLGAISPSSESRFDRIFDAGQKAYIESRLEPIDF